MTPFLIGLAGGTGSGKTTVANAISKRVGEERIAILSHDAYYRDFVDLPKDILDRQNFDHPDSLESELLVRHLKALKQGMVVETPIYEGFIPKEQVHTALAGFNSFHPIGRIGRPEEVAEGTHRFDLGGEDVRPAILRIR